MKEIVTQITKCYDCPYATNSSQLHNDSFTSAPLPLIWYCLNPDNKGINENFIIDDPYRGIDKRCQL